MVNGAHPNHGDGFGEFGLGWRCAGTAAAAYANKIGPGTAGTRAVAGTAAPFMAGVSVAMQGLAAVNDYNEGNYWGTATHAGTGAMTGWAATSSASFAVTGPAMVGLVVVAAVDMHVDNVMDELENLSADMYLNDKIMSAKLHLIRRKKDIINLVDQISQLEQDLAECEECND